MSSHFTGMETEAKGGAVASLVALHSCQCGQKQDYIFLAPSSKCFPEFLSGCKLPGFSFPTLEVLIKFSFL